MNAAVERDTNEARAVLDRVERDSEVLGTSRFAATAGRAARHFGAADADRDDPIEVWGTRVGRVAGLVGFVALAAYLLLTYVLR